MEEFDEIDDLEYGGRFLGSEPESDGFEDLDEEDFADLYEDEDEEVAESLDLERAYQALAEYRPDLLNPSIFQDVPSPYEVTQSAAGMALRVMGARDQIMSSVSGFGDGAREAALSVLSETPPEALMNPIAVDLIANFAIGEAVRQGQLDSVSSPFGGVSSVSGTAGPGGLGSFEAVFGAGQFTESERAQLRSAGL